MSDQNETRNPKDEVGKPLTVEQRQAFDDAGNLAESHANPRSGFDGDNPDQRLYSVSFDGSWMTDQDKNFSNPAKLKQLVDQVEHPRVIADYLPGVGTQSGPIDQYITGGALGDGSVQNVDKAYEEFSRHARTWQQENPNAEIHVSVTGFSRGASSSRDFGNKLYYEGVPAAGARPIVTNEIIGYTGQGGRASDPIYKVVYDDYVIPPGEIKIDSMLLYDTVDFGQKTLLNQEMPPIPEMRVLHITADHEFRDQFNGVRIIDPENPNDPRLLEIPLSGAHGSIGGVYGDNGIEALTLDIGHRFLRTRGVPIADTPDEWAPAEGEYIIHDSLRRPYTDFDGDRRYGSFSNPPVEGGMEVQPNLDMHLALDGAETPYAPQPNLEMHLTIDPPGAGIVNHALPEHLRPYDTDANWLAFVASEHNPLLVADSNGQTWVDEAALARQQEAYAAFLEPEYNNPANPNAPGYHYPGITGTTTSHSLRTDNGTRALCDVVPFGHRTDGAPVHDHTVHPHESTTGRKMNRASRHHKSAMLDLPRLHGPFRVTRRQGTMHFAQGCR